MKKVFSKTKLFIALGMMMTVGIMGNVVSTDTIAFKDFAKTNAVCKIESRVSLEDNSVVVNYAYSESSFAIPDLKLCYNVYKELSYSGKKYMDDNQNRESFAEQRKDYLAKEEEKMLEKTSVSSTPVAVAQPQYTSYSTSDGLTASGGVNYYGDQKETYYNLNMSRVVDNAQNAGLEGEYWVREDGVKMYGDYVIVAANQDVHPYGTTVDTSLGEGIVLDTGTFATGNPTQVDIATEW